MVSSSGENGLKINFVLGGGLGGRNRRDCAEGNELGKRLDRVAWGGETAGKEKGSCPAADRFNQTFC